MSLPTLKHSDHDVNVLDRRNRQPSKTYIPSHVITQQFGRYSHIRYNKTLVRGYIRNIANESSESVHACRAISFVTQLCRKYYYHKEDGIYQLGFQMYSTLQKCKKPAVSSKVLKVLIVKILGVKKSHYKSKTITCCVNELVKLDYITPIKIPNFEQKSESVVYKFTVEAHILFGRYHSLK